MDNNSQPAASGNKTGYMTHVSLLRALAMLTVVLHHSLCYYAVWSRPITDPAFKACGEYAYAVVAMFVKQTNLPVFLMLSGYLYAYLLFVRGKYGDARQFVWGKTKRLLIPYVFWALMLIMFFPLEHHCLANLPVNFCHLWFLLMLFEVSLIFHFTRHWWSRLPHWGLWVALVALFVLQWQFRDGMPSGQLKHVLRNVVVFMPYYALGIVMQRCTVRWNQVHWSAYAVAAVVSGWVLLAVITGSKKVPVPSLTFVLCDAAFVLCLFFLAEHYCKAFPKVAASKWLADLDRCGMGIYILHHIFIEAVTHTAVIIPWLNAHYYTGPVALFVVSLALSWSITHVMRKTRLRILIG